MARSKQAKAAGREQHRQTIRAKKMEIKHRKKATLPTRHMKNKR